MSPTNLFFSTLTQVVLRVSGSACCWSRSSPITISLNCAIAAEPRSSPKLIFPPSSCAFCPDGRLRCDTKNNPTPVSCTILRRLVIMLSIALRSSPLLWSLTTILRWSRIIHLQSKPLAMYLMRPSKSSSLVLPKWSSKCILSNPNVFSQ